MSISVTTPRKDYDDLLKDVFRNRKAVAGERAIKKEEEEFLPPLPSMCCTSYEDENGFNVIRSNRVTIEGRASYNIYLSLAYFYGASGRTVDGLSGLIFSKSAVCEIPTIIDYLKTNSNGKGNSLRDSAKVAVKEAMITPRSALLVDYPNTTGQSSILDVETGNLRPKILHYPYESIINWHYSVQNNEQKLTLAVLREVQETVVRRFEIEQEFQYRVLELIDNVYYQSLYDHAGSELKERKIILVNGQPSNEIPLFLIEVGAEQKAIINDLVDANLNHYRFFASYAAKEHASAFPIFYETGIIGDDENIIIGPNAKWSSTSSDAQFGVLQTASDGGSMRTYLLDMENRMAALGAEMLKPRIAGAESAEAKSLDQVAQNSTTSDVARTVSEAYTKALNFCSRWLGGVEDSIYNLNTDYNPKSMDAQTLTALIAAWQGGAISYDTFYDNLQKGEIAGNDRTAEEEKAMIVTDGTGLDE
jgi:hypothetical protein